MIPSILWSAPVPRAAKHPHNMMLPPRASRLGWCSSACKPPLFGYYGQTVLFLFHQTRGHFSKKYDLCPHVHLLTVVWVFLRFWSSGFFLAERPFRLCRYRTFYCGYRYFFTCFLQHRHKVLCCCSGIDLHSSHQSTFISRRQNTSPSWAVWRLRGPMVIILAYYCLYRWTWYLQVFGNCSQCWTRLVEVYNFSWGLGWFL